jgi:phosphodiesterase/alkaline phosphatase D-like protein
MASTRRRFLRSLLLAPVAAGCATVGATGAGRSPFTHGPAAADVTARSAVVWHRTRGPARVRIEYGTDPGLSAPRTTEAVAVTADTDYTVAIDLADLEPGREYFYRGVALDGDGRAPARGPLGRVRTAPTGPAGFAFAWSADMEAGQQPFALLDRIAERDPHLFLLLGDTIYADIPRNRFAPSLAFYRAKHRENRDDGALQRLLARTPVVAIWDDHEVENDFNRTHEHLAEGRRAFREYWPGGSAGGTVLHRRLAWGAAADFFVLDCRQYRSPQTQPDGPDKSMLGPRQRRWLEDELTGSGATFKFVVSSVRFLAGVGPDSWGGYVTERDALLRLFARTPGVVVLSGDIHAALHARRGSVHEFTVGPIAAWPLCRYAPDARAALQRLPFHICDEPNYGLVTIRTDGPVPEAEVLVLDGANTVRYRAVVPGAS